MNENLPGFADLGLDPGLLLGVQDLGFEKPTPIQAQTIPILLSGDHDLFGLAQTGSGKTAAFGLPLLQHLDLQARGVQALVLSPTRELCVQISNDLEKFAGRTEGVRILAVYGGAGIQAQISRLRSGVQVVVATPGRLMDLMERKALDLSVVQTLVLDEADEMLDMGFRDDLDYILTHAAGRRRTWLFSATMPPEIKKMADRFLKDPQTLRSDSQSAAPSQLEHWSFQVPFARKYEALKRLIDAHPEMYGIVFTRTKAEAQELTEKLIREGYDLEALHGDLSQAQRDKVMARFRERSLQLMVATDVAARGIDVKDSTHVVHYSIPEDSEVYTHRSGRTARAGKAGVSMVILGPKDTFRLKQIEKQAKVRFQVGTIPSGSAIAEVKLRHFFGKIASSEPRMDRIGELLQGLQPMLDGMDRDTLIQKLVWMEFERLFRYYALQNDADMQGRQAMGEMPAGRGHSEREDQPGLQVNLGTRDGFYKASMLQFLLDHSGLQKADLGKIILGDSWTTVQAEQESLDQIRSTFDGARFRGRAIRVTAHQGGRSNDRPAYAGPRNGGKSRPPFKRDYNR